MDGWTIKPYTWEKEPEELKKQMHKLANPPICNKYNNILLDVIFVLAGGLTDNGEVHEWVTRRLDLAYSIYKNISIKPKIICLGGGTYHKPPILNDEGYVVHESTACSEYLINLGVKSSDIYKEWSSYDTIANGYFSLMNYTMPMNFNNILVITSDFHIIRSKFIFNWIYSMINKKYNIYFESASDEGIDPTIITTRSIREKSSLNNLIGLSTKINNLVDFCKWFYEEHKAYCSFVEENEVIDPLIRKSY